MELQSEFINRHIAKLKSDASLSEETRERRIAIYEAMRPDRDSQSDIKSDIERWSKGETSGSGKVTGGSKLSSENPKKDIESWAKSKQ